MPRNLAALGVTTREAGVAAFQLYKTGGAATRTETGARAFRGDGMSVEHAGQAGLALAHETDLHHMLLDRLADGRQQRGHIAAAHPLPAARIENGLQFIHHKADIAAAPEHRRD